MMTKNTVQENRVHQEDEMKKSVHANEGRRTRTLIPINISTVIDGGTATTFMSAGSGKEDTVLMKKPLRPAVLSMPTNRCSKLRNMVKLKCCPSA